MSVKFWLKSFHKRSLISDIFFLEWQTVWFLSYQGMLDQLNTRFSCRQFESYYSFIFTLHIVENKLFYLLPVLQGILNQSFRVVENLHFNFNNVENLDCTFHIGENITKHFPNCGNYQHFLHKILSTIQLFIKF